MNDELVKLSSLQDIDKQILEIKAKKAEEAAALAAAGGDTKKAEELVQARMKALQDSQKARKTIEIEAAGAEERARKLQGRLLEVKTNQEYAAVQEEIRQAKSQTDECETRVLTQMEEEEVLKTARKAAEAELDVAKKNLDQKARESQGRQAEWDQALAGREKARADVEASLSAKVKALYDKVRSNRDGIGLAKAEGNRCGECMVALPPQLIIQIRKSSDPVLCLSCGRILILENKVEAPH